MKHVLIVISSLLITVLANSQTKISLSEVSKHIGDSIQLNAKVIGVKNLPAAKGSPTFISFGAAYPNQLLTAVIWDDVRKQMLIDPTEENLKDKTVLVIGKLELYKGKPQIVIKNPSQFQISDKEGEVLQFKN